MALQDLLKQPILYLTEICERLKALSCVLLRSWPSGEFGGEDTCRTLTTVGSADIVLAAAKGPVGRRGADPQTLRGVPAARRPDLDLSQ